MKLISQRNPATRRGSALLVVLVLVGIMEVLVLCNTRVLDNLKQELDFLDQKQTRKFAPAPAPPKPLQP